MTSETTRGNAHGRVCPKWMAYTFDNRFRRLFHAPPKLLGPYVSPGSTVLDIGCGLGFFSIGMAKLVGEDGFVVAADIQAEMLGVLEKRAERAGVAEQIATHRATPDRIGLDRQFDFALACWVVHEVPDMTAFMSEVRSLLKPGARFLVMEPRTHVSETGFEKTITCARLAGLRLIERPRISLSRSAVFERPRD